MKRFLTILLAAVLMLSAFATMTMGVAATDTSAQVTYLSDITPTSWKMLGGNTPGYNVYYEDGTPLVLAGETYEKGLSTHPISMDDAAEFVYDISGYDYTTFTAIVGKTDRYVTALPNSYTTFQVYVDGVLADEVVDLKAGNTYTFNVDVTGASELKLVTGAGKDNITCDGSVWANAKLSYGYDEPVNPPADPPSDPVDPPSDPVTPPVGSETELYLSDANPKSATAHAGPFYDQNEQGEELLLNGITYDKGIWTHPMSNADAESVYNISGYNYTVFYAIVGKEEKYVNANPGSFLTFRVYVDGVLVDEVVDLVAGETYIFKINIAGASELKLVTGAGSDNITCDGAVWANAKLTTDANNCQEHTWDEGKLIKDSTCAEVGQMHYHCKNCVGDKIEEIPLIPHTVGEWAIGEQATCTEAGTKVQKCTECNQIVNSTTWDAKGHVPGAWVTTKSATCTEAGKKTQSCETCGIVLAEEDIPALGHCFGDWTVVGDQQVRVCECGEQEVRSGCASLLSVGTAGIMLLAVGAVILPLSKKKTR